MNAQSWQAFQQQFDSTKTYVLAVSGGVDSVVMLDMMCQIPDLKLVVAHFDHGIRGDSSQRDAEFVKQLAEHYNLPYEIGWGLLSKQASEDQARQARYRFLRSVAEKNNGVICVAHHQDDVIETIALNLTRGTGWRGLAVMGMTDVMRPMLTFTKQQLLDYARLRKLSWCEDETNQSNRYLRNQLRRKIKARLSPDAKQLLIELYQHQWRLRRAIESETQRLIRQLRVDNGSFQRHFIIMIDELSAGELLNAIFRQECGVSLTRPQLDRAIWAIKTALPGTSVQLGEGAILKFTRQQWSIDKK